MQLSVVICTHNPKKDILRKVLDALKAQIFNFTLWELILVDNKSNIPLAETVDLSWHENGKIIIEEELGLAHARLRGVKESKSELIVFVDDDNVLDKDYLRTAHEFYIANPQVGCFGGKSLPVYETTPPNWFFEANISLGCQDFGDEKYVSNYKSVNFNLTEYPIYAPIGTGMVISKQAFLAYDKEVRNHPIRLSLGRKGQALTSGEDNDIIISIVKNGFEIAYLPELIVTHLIPANRYSKEYMRRMSYESNRSWVKVLNIHNICPWLPIYPFTLSFRKIKSYLQLKAWKSEVNYIKWKGVCGIYKGQSELN